MLRQIHRLLRTARPESIVVVSLVGMLIVGWADAQTGPTIDIAVLLRPVAIAKLESDDEVDIAREVRLQFTADHGALPLRLSVDIAYVPLTIELAETCSDFAACRTP